MILATRRTLSLGTRRTRRRRPLHGSPTLILAPRRTLSLGTRRTRRRRPLHGRPASRLGTHLTPRPAMKPGTNPDALPRAHVARLARAQATPGARTSSGTRPRHSSEPRGRPRAPVSRLVHPPRDRKSQGRQAQFGGAADDGHQRIAQDTTGCRGTDVVPQLPSEGGVAVRAQRRGEAGLRDGAGRPQDPLDGGRGGPAATAATVRAPGRSLRGRPDLRPLRTLRLLGTPRPPPPPEQPHPQSLLPFSPLHQGGDL
ncbi:hypothetical protein Sliba_59480 [Streptomyces nigrescens]|uniref:Uncharacterized protein n=1 Tax=Streptomyces nigrescens TaxID=1920 RepID=A0A640TTQ1_STRNI|nr:hypothetical protein Sliba_59480 [Streptomyces libani subsp. libani]GGV98232.1 hypothetical protein GCM10010500_46240 [Streptomyces libani subsp. libani]